MNVRDIATKARRAGRQLANLSSADRTKLLQAMADKLANEATRKEIFAANRRDIEQGKQGQVAEALVKRLAIDDSKLDALCDGTRQLARRTECVGQVLEHRELDTDLILQKVSCPLGLLGVVFESRPDAVPQIASLAIKSGNAVLLKGGREATHTNKVLVQVLRDALDAFGISGDAIAYLESREEVAEMLELDDLMDLVVARGSGAFVEHVKASTQIAVLGHAEGLCHLYLHGDADPAMAARIAVDAKCSYAAACNAIETMLWSEGAKDALDAAVIALRKNDVELRGCTKTAEVVDGIKPAMESDWDEEYGGPILAIRYVENLEAALCHIEAHGSKHTETIITGDSAASQRFIDEVDAACVFHNASSRFADGYRFGLGAEVGISTGKLHARGPVGVEGLLTCRWLLRGDGQISTDYGPGEKALTHVELDS